MPQHSGCQICHSQAHLTTEHDPATMAPYEPAAVVTTAVTPFPPQPIG